MGFSKMMELLQEKEKRSIVLCNLGSFYVAVGKDAVLLNEILGLKVSCLKEEICKVGFPTNALEKYTRLIEEKDYSYVVYFFDQQKEELTAIKRFAGKKENQIKEKQVNCYLCAKSTKVYSEMDKYILAFKKLQENTKEGECYSKTN